MTLEFLNTDNCVVKWYIQIFKWFEYYIFIYHKSSNEFWRKIRILMKMICKKAKYRPVSNHSLKYYCVDFPIQSRKLINFWNAWINQSSHPKQKPIHLGFCYYFVRFNHHCPAPLRTSDSFSRAKTIHLCLPTALNTSRHIMGIQ